jgi:prepilin-type processing-associated H-X9-DG protein
MPSQITGAYTSGNVRWCGMNTPQFPYLTPTPDYSNATSGDGGGRFGAAHPGGCQFVFGDGSVRKVNYSVGGDVFYKICNIADGQAVSESDYE